MIKKIPINFYRAVLFSIIYILNYQKEISQSNKSISRRMIVTSSTNLFKSKKLLLDRYFPKEINTNRFLNTLNDELNALVQKNRIIFKGKSYTLSNNSKEIFITDNLLQQEIIDPIHNMIYLTIGNKEFPTFNLSEFFVEFIES
ncbi:MAG: hypothetical protein CL703_03760 [Chloroflexi bacterium]|nr:hypothetical protein [Chloroflexota bacterium]|tara:strand:- start:281 stop:712 length:432 start_codon:yes stop_codon:yes gene_type:complete